MKASFDSKELLASLADLERRAREHGPSTPLAAIPSAQLSIDLAAILASVKSRSAPQAAMVEDAAQLTDNRTPNHSAPPRSSWRVSAAPAIVIAISLLVGGASYHAWSRMALVASQAPPALQNYSAPPETTAGATVAEQTADSGPAAAEPPAVAPPAAAKTLAPVDPSAPAAAPSKTEAPVAETTKPVKKPKKISADKSQTREPRTERHAKSKPVRVAKPRGAPGAAVTPDNVNAEPAVISDARRVTQTITGVLNGWVGVDPHALR